MVVRHMPTFQHKQLFQHKRLFQRLHGSSRIAGAHGIMLMHVTGNMPCAAGSTGRHTLNT